MKKFLQITVLGCFIFSLVFCLFINKVSADMPKSIKELQAQRSGAKLFLPNFVVIGEKASFKVVSKPNYNVQLKLEYDNFDSETYSSVAANTGLCIFDVNIKDDKDLIGKSVLVEAYVWSDDNKSDIQKALPQDNEKIGNSTLFDRVYITDKDSAKGFLISPSQILNQYLMNTNYQKGGDFTPLPNEYTNDTPVYIKNMRDASDNVRQVRQTINNTDRQ